MSSLDLNFKRRYPLTSMTGLLVLLVAVSAATVVAFFELQLQQQVSAAEQKLKRLEKEGKRRIQSTRAPDAAALKLEMSQANEILNQLGLPWGSLFAAIESSNEQRVALLSVQPDAQRRMLRLAGEAKNFDALLSYISRLEQNDSLYGVTLTQHEIRTQDPERPVRFTLVANWGEGK